MNERDEFDKWWERYNSCPRCSHSSRMYASNAWMAGRESMRAERDHWCKKYGSYVDKWNDSDRLRNQRDLELKYERERSQKLIVGLKIMTIGNTPESKRAKELIAEYESQTK